MKKNIINIINSKFFKKKIVFILIFCMILQNVSFAFSNSNISIAQNIENTKSTNINEEILKPQFFLEEETTTKEEEENFFDEENLIIEESSNEENDFSNENILLFDEEENDNSNLQIEESTTSQNKNTYEDEPEAEEETEAELKNEIVNDEEIEEIAEEETETKNLLELVDEIEDDTLITGDVANVNDEQEKYSYEVNDVVPAGTTLSFAENYENTCYVNDVIVHENQANGAGRTFTYTFTDSARFLGGEIGYYYIMYNKIPYYKIQRWSTLHVKINVSNNNSSKGSVSPAGENSILRDETFTASATPKNGYEFSGWTGDKTSSNTTISFTADADYSISANFTTRNYSISYSLNGGSINSARSTYTVESSTYTLPTPTKTGYTFLGWTGSNGSSMQTRVSIPIGSTGNKSYTANWSENHYNISFDANGGVGSLPSGISNIAYETESYTIPSHTLTNRGYNFLGWSSNKGSSSASYYTGSSVNKLSSTNGQTVTLYAIWQVINYNMNYNLDGGNWDKTQGINTYTVNTKTYTLPDPIKRGFIFKNWVETTSGTEVKIASINTDNEELQNRSFKAIYEIINYNIIMDYDGGELVSGLSIPETYTVEDEDIKIQKAEKENNTFVGYFKNDETTLIPIPIILHDSIDDIKFTAQYVETPDQIAKEVKEIIQQISDLLNEDTEDFIMQVDEQSSIFMNELSAYLLGVGEGVAAKGTVDDINNRIVPELEKIYNKACIKALERYAEKRTDYANNSTTIYNEDRKLLGEEINVSVTNQGIPYIEKVTSKYEDMNDALVVAKDELDKVVTLFETVNTLKTSLEDNYNQAKITLKGNNYLTEDEINNLIEDIDDITTKAKEDIDTEKIANYKDSNGFYELDKIIQKDTKIKEEADDKINEILKESNAIAKFNIYKEDEKDLIKAKEKEAKNTIDNYLEKYISNDEKEEFLDELTQIVDLYNENITVIELKEDEWKKDIPSPSYAEVDNIEKEAIQKIDELLQKVKEREELNKTKLEANEQIETKSKEVLDNININTDLTNEQKEEFKNQIESTVSDAKDAIKIATSIENVTKEKDDTLKKLEEINNIANLELEKKKAIKELNNYATGKENYIPKYPYLTTEEKENFTNLVEDAKDKGIETINDQTLIEDVWTEEENAIKNIDTIMQELIYTNAYNREKLNAIKELENYANSKIALIEADTNLTEDEKETFKTQITEEYNNTKNDIESLNERVPNESMTDLNLQNIANKVSDAKAVIDTIKADSDLLSSKNKSKKELEEKKNNLQKQINKLQNVLDTNKEEYIDELTQILTNYNSEIDNKTDIESVENQKKLGLNEMDAVLLKANGKKELNDKKDEAKEEIDKKVEEIIKEIEDNKNDGIITEEEAEELINKVASKSEISKDKVDNQTTKEDVENIKNDALQEIDNITNIEKIIDNKKEEAKEELNKKKEEAIELINSIKYASVSNAIKEDIITEIGNIKTNGDTAIDLAKDKEEIKNTLEEYIQKINDEIKKVDEALEFIEYKEQVKDDLNDIIEETKENIKNISSITDEEKENLYEELEKIKDKFPQFDTLDKKEDVENLMEELIKDIEKVSTTAEVLDAKEKAKEQIDEEAKKEIKRDITKNEYLTEEEKNEFITKINEEATKAKAEIDKQEIDTIEKINNEVEKYKNTLDDISIEIQNKNNFYIEKEEIKVLIDNKAQKAKESIQNNKLLTEEEKIDYIQKVEQIRIDKNNEVDNKTYDMYEANNNILKEIKNDAYTQIDEILNEIKENTSIKSKIEEAIIELEEVKDIIKEAIENNDNLTNYEKNYYDKLLDDAFNDGENNIKNSKTEEEIKEALEKAKEELQNIANNADTVIAVSTPSESEKPNDEEEEESTPSEIIKTLEEEKQDAISNINKEKEEVIKEINDNNTLTDEEKEIYIKEVNDIVDKAIEDINNTQDKDTVSDIMKDAIEDLDDINDKANLNHKKDEIKKEIEKEANDLKDYIENTDDKILDPSKKQELKDQIDNIVNNKNNEIDQKETIYEIEKIFDEAKKELNDIKDLISEKEDFENKKEEAIKEIEKEINDLKDKINEAFDKGELTEEKKQELEEDLDKVLEDATNQINNSTTEEEINQNKQDALDKITNVENETFLQNEKDKAKEALERAIIDAMGKVFEEFDNNNITTSEKDELISNLQNIRTDGIASLNNTNSIQEVKESLDEFIGTTNDHKNSKIGDVLDKLQEIIDFKNFKEEIEKKLNDKIEEAKKEIIDKKIVEDDTNRLIEVLSNLKATSSNALKDQNTAEEVINTKNEANKIIEDTLNEANDIYNFLKIKEEAKKEIENKKDEILDLIEEDTFITDEEKQELKEKIASISNAYLEKIENDTLAEEVNIDKSEAITNLENTFKEEKNKRFDERKSVFLNDLREFTDRVKKAVDDDELVLEPKKVELKDGLEEEYVLASKRIEDIDKQNLNLYATEVLEKQVKTAKAAIVNVVVNFVKVIPEGKGGGNIEVVNEEKGPTSTTPDIEQGDVVIPGEDEPYETFPIHENIAIGAGGLGRMMLSSKASLTISSEDDQGNRTAKLHNTDLFNNTIFVTYKSDADDDTKYDDGYIAYATDENFIILTGWIYTTSGEVLFASVEDNENKGELYTGLKAIGKYYYYFNTSQNSYGSLVKSKYDSVSMISNGVYVNNEGKICTQDGTLITVK